jgi:hypothetical protein
MKLKMILAVVVMFLSFSAFADDTKGSKKSGPTTSFCEADDCGSLPPTNGETGTTSGGGETKCLVATSYDTCVTKCTCEFNKALKKCGTYGYWCKSVATSDKNACLGLCLTDWL